jgi:transposase-like protein
MNQCRRCDSANLVKNGFFREKQRYLCKDCGYNFVEGDQRVNDSLPAKKALAVLLCSLGKASFNMLGHIFGASRSLTYRWTAEAAATLPEPEVPWEINEMEFDEMWHYIGSKK